MKKVGRQQYTNTVTCYRLYNFIVKNTKTSKISYISGIILMKLLVDLTIRSVIKVKQKIKCMSIYKPTYLYSKKLEK